MIGAGLDTNLDFIDSVYSAEFSALNKGLKMTNEIMRNDYEFGGMMEDKIELQGGGAVKFDTLLRKSGNTGFASAGKTRTFASSQHNVKGQTHWSVYEAGFLVDDIEELLNGEADPFQIFDLIPQKEAGMMTEAHNELEETYFHETGNAELVTGDDPPFFGLKALVTRDGRAVDGTSTVLNINTSTDKRWLNRYCGPLGSNLNPTFAHTTTDAITSANQLLAKIEKALRFCQFKGITQLKFVQDDKAKDILKKQRILADEMSYEAIKAIQKAIGNGRDQIAAEEMVAPDPVIKGLPVVWCSALGLGATMPTYVHSQVVDAGGGSITGGATTYANTGEVYLVNQANLRVIGHKRAFPQKKPMAFIVEKQAILQLFRWMLAVVCNSRQRQCCIWGYSGLKAS